MNILVSFFVIIFVKSFGCSFNKKVSKIISLSGPVTVLLRETGLLKDPHLKGISVFNPITESEFKGKVYPGGLFLAQSIVPEFQEAIVFYDEGRQFLSLLKREPTIQGIEIKTRSLAPLEVSDLVVRKISPFVNGCSEEFKKFVHKGRTLQDALMREISSGLKVVFYLGEITQTRFPELVIANDGAVKLLKEKKIIHTYPSNLAYVNWSARVKAELPKETLHVGVVDSGRKSHQIIKKSPLGETLIYPGALVPGISQMEAFLFWARQK
jgi:hypothetical protein